MTEPGAVTERIDRIVAGEERLSLADAERLLEGLRDDRHFGDARKLWRHMIEALGYPEDDWRAAHQLLARAEADGAWERAKEIIESGQPVEFDTGRRLANVLRKYKSFKQARRLLRHMIDHPHPAGHDARKAHQTLAMALYHDGEYAKGPTLQEAWDILTAGQSIEDATRDPPDDKEKAEHLGIAGAIAKRRYAVSGRLEDLEEAQALYDAAVRQSERDEPGPRSFNDNGYAAINAAYVREVLAANTRDEERAKHLQEGADLLRRDIVHDLEQKPKSAWNWWEAATYAEAKLGQGDATAANEAVRLFADHRIVDLGEWERETTARQLARLAVVRHASRKEPTGPEIGDLLRHIAQSSHGRYPGSLRGTLGLGLSGGGFRASLFHLGMLARLAELDLLRYVSVLSCVSGGSIVGAHYYLALQEMLERKHDANIHRDDYVELVRRVIETFCAGVKHNVRGEAFSIRNAARKLRSLVTKTKPYTRTLHAGELFDEHFYDKVGKPPSKRPRPLYDLLVTPEGETWFNPKLHNWRRAAKVPMLVINATTLNTGNNWQFAATWMGEPDSDYYTADIDPLPNVSRMYLSDEVPEGYRDYPVSSAVGASACVPLVFPPIALPGILDKPGVPSDRTLALADGGLQDNQGLGALIDQDCSHVLISDASGQLKDKPSLAALGAAVALRASSIQGRTIRTNLFLDIGERERAVRLKAWVIHLTRDMRKARDEGRKKTAYGVPYEVQELLAALRTDLDAFSDLEAKALMLSAYRMTSHALENQQEFPENAAMVRWPFSDVAAAFDNPGSAAYDELVRELSLGRHAVGRALRRRFGR